MSIGLVSFLAAFAVMLISLSGILFAAGPLRAWAHRNLPYLATFAGGVFLIVVFHLLEESLHEGSVALAAGAILVGAALMEALHHLLPDTHHHHETEHAHTHTPIDGRRVLLSDALHNVGDGVLIVAAFAADWYVGLAAAAGVLIHEFVQEIAEFFVLREAGYTTREALMRNFAASATILLGVAVALFLASAEEIALLFAGLAAGGFIAVILRDIVPHTVEHVRHGGRAAVHAATLLLGVALMLAIQTVRPHEEVRIHDEEHLGAAEVLSVVYTRA